MWVNYFRRLAYYTAPLNLGLGTSLMGQWLLNLCISTAGWRGKVWPLVGELRSCMFLGQENKAKQTRLYRCHSTSQAVPWRTAVMGVPTRPSCPTADSHQGSPTSCLTAALADGTGVTRWGGALPLGCLTSSPPHRHQGEIRPNRWFQTVTQNKG